ncbi:YkgJ family cysteine cluster protein [Fundidesulfovibrio butyratiphilus]
MTDPTRNASVRPAPDADHDATQAFLESLPELLPGRTYQFACHPGVPCFNQCCSDLTLPLTPYDVLRLRRNLGFSGQQFLDTHAVVLLAPDTGLPVVRLRMRQEVPGAPCPFVSPKGCTVYPDRPGACRTYPLGRATREDENGQVVEQFFVVREPHCKGFEEDKHWTSETWLADQGLPDYNRVNDRYMHLLAQAKTLGLRLAPQKANLVLLALYSLDAFKEFIARVGVFDLLDISDQDRQQVLADEERRLDFALDWLDLVLFGRETGLRRKPR